MASQKHLKQFGDGLSRLEYVISDVSEDMFSIFKDAATSGILINPKETTFDAALNTISLLLTGVRNKEGDEILEKMRRYEKMVLTFLGANDLSYMEYNIHPSIRHLNMSSWKTIKGVKELQISIWKDVQELNETNPDAKSLFTVLMAHVAIKKDDKDPEGMFSGEDVQMTILSLLLAGVATTSTSFYGLINILAHRRHIQDKLFEEVKKVGRTNDPITLSDRQNMPYCRAVLLEVLRYASVVPLGVLHRTTAEVDICGIRVPPDTSVSTNLWGLHHDPDFWADPYSFIPERFLDADGDIIPADHPNRKHLIPFGAGPRVCLGEAMALARIFIWIATFTQRFQVFPADDNTWEKSDARNYEFDGIVRVCPYKVKFVQRQSYHD
jgi:cytochrome P450